MALQVATLFNSQLVSLICKGKLRFPYSSLYSNLYLPPLDQSSSDNSATLLSLQGMVLVIVTPPYIRDVSWML